MDAYLLTASYKGLSDKSDNEKTNSWANARFDPIRSWLTVRRDLLNSSALNKEDWDITLSSCIEVSKRKFCKPSVFVHSVPHRAVPLKLLAIGYQLTSNNFVKA